MILKTFSVKKSSGPQAGTKQTCSAIEYLLNEKDWQDKPREQKPEVLKTGRGGLEGLNQNILNNHREHTYTSGVLAFKDKEWSTMTPEKKEFVMQRFLDNMLPVEAQNRVPYAFIEHQGEIHFIISKAWELDNGKTLAFNVDPPAVIKKGKKAPFDPSKDYKETLQEILNYELGFDKVEHNPLSIYKSKTDYLDDGVKIYEFKKSITVDMRKTIGRIGTTHEPEANIKNRYELAQFISEKYNVDCEFKKDRNEDYLLVKPRNNGKDCPITENVKLYSPAFEYKSNYVEIAKEYNRITDEKASGTHKLKNHEYEEKLVKLEKGRRQKEAFNEKFNKKTSLGRKHLYEKGADGKKSIVKGKAQKLREAKEAIKNPNSPNAGSLKKVAPGLENQQKNKKPIEQVEDKVAVIIEETIAERKIDLKMDGETMKNDDKKQQQSLSKTVNSSNKNTAPANNNSSNNSSSNSNVNNNTNDDEMATGDDIKLRIGDIDTEIRMLTGKLNFGSGDAEIKAKIKKLEDEKQMLLQKLDNIARQNKAKEEAKLKQASSMYHLKLTPPKD
jgi:hypothetical protein